MLHASKTPAVSRDCARADLATGNWATVEPHAELVSGSYVRTVVTAFALESSPPATMSLPSTATADAKATGSGYEVDWGNASLMYSSAKDGNGGAMAEGTCFPHLCPGEAAILSTTILRLVWFFFHLR